MNNLIIIPKNIIPDSIDSSVLTYSIRNPDKIIKLCNILKKGRCNRKTAMKLSGFSHTTYYKIKRCAEAALEYCESNNIDYKNTDFCDVINAYNMIEESIDTAKEKLVNKIYDQLDDKETVDPDGKVRLLKRGDVNAAFKLLQVLDPEEWTINNNNNVNVNIDTNKQKVGVQIELVDFSDVIDIAAEEQNELINKTREK